MRRDVGVRALGLAARVAPYAKAAGAGVGAFLGALAIAAGDGTTTGNEWLQVAVATITAAAGAYAAPKNRERGAHATQS